MTQSSLQDEKAQNPLDSYRGYSTTCENTRTEMNQVSG